MNKKGLTLLELILALAIVSVVLFAMSTMSLTGMRFTKMGDESMDVQNELIYIFRDIEFNLRDIRLGDDSPSVTRDSNEVTLFARKFDDADGTISYTYDFTDKTLTRDDNGTSEILSKGYLEPYAAIKDYDGKNGIGDADRTLLEGCLELSPIAPSTCDEEEAVPVFEIVDKKVIMVSFKSASQVGTKDILSRGMTKNIYIHATEESDE